MSTTSPGTEMPASYLNPEHRPRIEVLDEDKIQAIHVADQWNQTYDAGVTLNTSRNIGDWEACYWGVLAELVLARVTGSEVDTSTYQHGDDGADLEIDGKTVDVKLIHADLSAPTAPDPRLLVERGEVEADRYILAQWQPGRPDWGEHDRIEILGECDAETVRTHEPEEWPRDIPNHAVPLELLEAPNPDLDSS